MQATTPPADAPRSVRAAKLDAARGAGIEPYPYRFEVDTGVAAVRAAHADLPPDTVTEHHVRLAGRLVGRRRHGHLGFVELRDGTGAIQLYLDTSVLGAAAHRAVAATSTWS